MTKGIGLLLCGMVIVAGCGGRRRASTPPSVGGSSNASVTRAAGPAVARAGEPGGALMGTGTAADPFLLCHMNGGAGRTDYAFVANWHCSDGSMPLGGIEERGAAARVGNVGDGPDGHIVDLYRISCPSGPVDLYVDGYHCGAVSTEVDVYHLSREQLGRMAQLIRTLHAHPEEFERRRDLMIWVIETPQVAVETTTSMEPGVLKPVGDNDFIHIIMPMHFGR